jgi:type I restriction enzyme R subunit
MKDVMLERRKEELGLYKLHNKYSALKVALYKSIKDLIWADEPRG